jgi:hypothetical protein
LTRVHLRVTPFWKLRAAVLVSIDPAWASLVFGVFASGFVPIAIARFTQGSVRFYALIGFVLVVGAGLVAALLFDPLEDPGPGGILIPFLPVAGAILLLLHAPALLFSSKRMDMALGLYLAAGLNGALIFGPGGGLSVWALGLIAGLTVSSSQKRNAAPD